MLESHLGCIDKVNQRSGAIQIASYLELVKPRLLFLSILSSVFGYILALQNEFQTVNFFLAIFGTTCVGAGSMALNEYMEREPDAQMLRTATRPIPVGIIQPWQALVFGIAIAVIGILSLGILVSAPSAFLAFCTLISYLLVYTPLKKITSLATFAGAVPGALPPLIGWTAAGGELNFQALVLFLILFFWQIPHFLSIDWMYRDDYARAGFKTLSAVDTTGTMVARQMIVNMSALLSVSLLPTIAGLAKGTYFFGAFLLGICFGAVIVASISNLNERARYVLRASVIYLPLLMLLMVMNKG